MGGAKMTWTDEEVAQRFADARKVNDAEARITPPLKRTQDGRGAAFMTPSELRQHFPEEMGVMPTLPPVKIAKHLREPAHDYGLKHGIAQLNKETERGEHRPVVGGYADHKHGGES